MKRHSNVGPHTLDYLCRCILEKDGPNSPLRQDALLKIANALHLIVEEALKGDEDCGDFLGELLPFFQKKHKALARANAVFSMRYVEIKKAHLVTSKESILRPLIIPILAEAQRERWRQKVEKLVPGFPIEIRLNKLLLSLPELRNTPKAIDAWTNLLVYPELKKKEEQTLRRHFETGKLNKARDQNGKFQMSRLKPAIRETVARIARQPRFYYSNPL